MHEGRRRQHAPCSSPPTASRVVDTKNPGLGPAAARQDQERHRQAGDAIINTHTHCDHVSGNVEFPATVDVVTHENTAKMMQDDGARSPASQTGRRQPNIFKAERRPRAAEADVQGQDDDRQRQRPDRAATTSAARTPSGDAFVLFPALRVMHTGDTFPNKGMPIMDANNGGSGVEYPARSPRRRAVTDIDTSSPATTRRWSRMRDMKMYSEFIRDFVATVRAAKKAGQRSTTWRVRGRCRSASRASYADSQSMRDAKSNVEVDLERVEVRNCRRVVVTGSKTLEFESSST